MKKRKVSKHSTNMDPFDEPFTTQTNPANGQAGSLNPSFDPFADMHITAPQTSSASSIFKTSAALMGDTPPPKVPLLVSFLLRIETMCENTRTFRAAIEGNAG
jgi:hypothetical protein